MAERLSIMATSARPPAGSRDERERRAAQLDRRDGFDVVPGPVLPREVVLEVGVSELVDRSRLPEYLLLQGVFEQAHEARPRPTSGPAQVALGVRESRDHSEHESTDEADTDPHHHPVEETLLANLSSCGVGEDPL